MKKLFFIAFMFSVFLKAENSSMPPLAFGVDYLYWETKQDSMDYGYCATSQTTSLTEDFSGLPVNLNAVDAVNKKIIRSKFKYESGFRASLGYASPCADFDCNLIYTYLPNKVKTTTDRQSKETIFTIFTPLSLSSIKAKWSSFFNQLDVDFGRKMHFGNLIELAPHVGIRGVIVNQQFNVRSNFITPATDTLSPPVGTNTTFNRWKQNFYGIGVEAGLGAAMHFGCHVSLIGHFGGAILCSKFKVKNAYEAAIIADESSTPKALSYDQDTIKAPTPVFDFFIGLDYKRPFYNTYLSFRLGWEQHVFFDMNRLQVGSDEYGNLSTSGLTAALNCLF